MATDEPLKSLLYAAVEIIVNDSLGALGMSDVRLLVDPITIEQIRETYEIKLHNLGCERAGQIIARFPAALYGVGISLAKPVRGFSLHIEDGCSIVTKPPQWFAVCAGKVARGYMVDLFEAVRELGLVTIAAGVK